MYSDELLDSLNGMHQLMTGEEHSFDKVFYNELVQCIEKYDPKLIDVVNSQWLGFKAYANKGGNPGTDDWIRCDTRVHLILRILNILRLIWFNVFEKSLDIIYFVTFYSQHFLEHNCTVQAYGNIPIWEPCNYASNVAYYHDFIEICHHEGWSFPSESGSFRTCLDIFYV